MTQGKKHQHEPMIIAFKQIIARLHPLLSDTENEAMDFHLYYLEEVYRIQYELSKISQTILNDIEQIRTMPTDVYDHMLMRKLFVDLSIWTDLKDESEAILHEDGIRALRVRPQHPHSVR